MDSVIYVFWFWLVSGQCSVSVMAWFFKWTVCCMYFGVVFLMDSFLDVLWRGFVNGHCAVFVVAWVC